MTRGEGNKKKSIYGDVKKSITFACSMVMLVRMDYTREKAGEISIVSGSGRIRRYRVDGKRLSKICGIKNFGCWSIHGISGSNGRWQTRMETTRFRSWTDTRKISGTLKWKISNSLHENRKLTNEIFLQRICPKTEIIENFKCHTKYTMCTNEKYWGARKYVYTNIKGVYIFKDWILIVFRFANK